MDSTKTIVSQSPDITVVVGSGDNAEDFWCCRVILASASPVLDAMLSSGMKESAKKRIEFPDKDPDEWRMVLRCIDTARVGLFRRDTRVPEGSDQSELMNDRNVYVLVPWFNELQMKAYLDRCEEILNDYKVSGGLEKDTELLMFAIKYNLVRTQRQTTANICCHLEQFCWGFGDPDVFNLSIIQQLIGLFPSIDDAKIPHCEFEPFGCKDLWNQMTSWLDLSTISLDVIRNSDAFPYIVHYALQSYHLSMKSELQEIAALFDGQVGPCFIKSSWFSEDTEELKGDADGELLKKCDVENAVRGIILNECHRYSHAHKNVRYSHTKKVVRRYVLKERNQQRKKTVYIVRKEQEAKAEVVTTPDQSSEREEKSIRSSETDLTVVVGSGDKMKEFQCHTAILAFASTKLDSLVAKSDGKLSFPYMNSNDWVIFYNCIGPNNNGAYLEDNGIDFHDAHLTKAKLLLPFFCEFEMDAYLKCCSHYLQTDAGFIIEYCLTDVEAFQDIIYLTELLQLAVKYNFAELKETVEDALKTWYERGMIFEYTDDFEFGTVHGLVSMCLPIQRESTQDLFSSTGSCIRLWEGLRAPIEAHLKVLTFDRVDIGDCEWFAHLVHSFFCIEKLKRGN
jgi:hypothetical protein